MSGKDDSEVELIDTEPFDSDRPIGSQWIPREVIYFAESESPPEDCCEAEAEADPEEPRESTKPIGDFPHFWGINFGVLTRRSYDILHELIAPHVEFLPLDSKEGDFIAFKVLRFVDALDSKESVIEWFPQLKKDVGKPRIAHTIKRHAFREELLTNEVIFRIPQMPFYSRVFVTEAFIDCVNTNGLEGFQFWDVWPPTDPSIERQRYLAKRQRKKGRRLHK